MGRSTVLWYLNKKYHIISCCVSTSFVWTLKIKGPIKDICKNLLAGLHLSASEQHVCHNQFLLRQELRKHNSSITEFHKKPCIICIIIKVGSWHLFCKRFTLKDLGNNAWPICFILGHSVIYYFFLLKHWGNWIFYILLFHEKKFKKYWNI